MASNYTQHVQLPLWEPDDDFLREEFNEENQKLDTALRGLDSKIDGTIVTGTYTGTAPTSSNKVKQTVTLGFRPRFLFVRDTSYKGSTAVSDNWTPFYLGFASPGHGQWVYGSYQVLEITADGFTAGGINGFFNNSGTVYAYLAVR